MMLDRRKFVLCLVFSIICVIKLSCAQIYSSEPDGQSWWPSISQPDIHYQDQTINSHKMPVLFLLESKSNGKSVDLIGRRSSSPDYDHDMQMDLISAHETNPIQAVTIPHHQFANKMDPRRDADVGAVDWSQIMPHLMKLRQSSGTNVFQSDPNENNSAKKSNFEETFKQMTNNLTVKGLQRMSSEENIDIGHEGGSNNDETESQNGEQHDHQYVKNLDNEEESSSPSKDLTSDEENKKSEPKEGQEEGHVEKPVSNKKGDKSKKLMKGFQPVKDVTLDNGSIGWQPLKGAKNKPRRLSKQQQHLRKVSGRPQAHNLFVDPALGNYFGQPLMPSIFNQLNQLSHSQQYANQHVPPFQAFQRQKQRFHPLFSSMANNYSPPSRSLFRFRPQSAFQPFQAHNNWMDSEFLQLSAMQDENKPQHIEPPSIEKDKEVPLAHADTPEGKEKVIGHEGIDGKHCCDMNMGYNIGGNQFDDQIGNPFNGFGHEARPFMPAQQQGHEHMHHGFGCDYQYPFPSAQVPFYLRPKLRLFRRPQVYWG